MPLKAVEKIWMNGKLVNWNDAKIHVLSHVVHYGSSWFEGIRCYDTKKGRAIFRLREHVERLFDSTRIHYTEIPYTVEQIENAIIETIRVNNVKSCYIRPIAYRGYNDLGVNPISNPVDVAVAVWDWGKYLGNEALTSGIDVCISSWMRPAPNTFPSLSKSGGNYLNASLIKVEAIRNGFAEGIALDVNGFVSEGSGENVFLVKNGVVYTPALSSSILGGITRASVITLLEKLNIPVKEMLIPREMLTIADEAFFTGTAAEVTPIRSINHSKVGEGKPGKVTKAIQEKFFAVIEDGADPYGWLKFV
jgi:branched-chain amino acid aminotransferase